LNTFESVISGKAPQPRVVCGFYCRGHAVTVNDLSYQGSWEALIRRLHLPQA
jgi:hypothetical protein